MEDLLELIQQTSDRICALRERSVETLRQDFPSDTPQLLAKLLLQLVDKVDDRLGQLASEANTATPASKDTLSRHVRLCACSVRNLAPYLRYIDGARLEHNPWHLVGQFERLCRHIVPRARVIIRPKWKYNYESRWLNRELNNQVKLLKHELRPIFERFPNFFVLSYTSAESEDLLQYAIWGHEIGHLYFQELSATDAEAVQTFSQAVSKAAPFDPKEIDDLLRFRFRWRLGVDPSDVAQSDYDSQKDWLTTQLASVRNRWLSEIFADLFAIRLLGPAPLYAFASLPLTDDELGQSAATHPSPRLRIAEMVAQIDRLGYREFFAETHLMSEDEETASVERQVKGRWAEWFKRVTRMGTLKRTEAESRALSSEDFAADEWKLQSRYLEMNLAKALPVVVDTVNAQIQAECFCSPATMVPVFRQVELLHNDLPPDIEGSDPRCLGTALTAGWLFWSTFGDAQTMSRTTYKEAFEKRKRTNRLLSKGIESATVQAEFEERKKFAPNARSVQSMAERDDSSLVGPALGLLSAPDLMHRMNDPDLQKKLYVRPLLQEDQVQEDSIDLRLGNTFLVMRRTTFPLVDIMASRNQFEERIEQYQGRTYVPLGKPFYIHPGQFVLASTLEFISMPRDLAGSLLGRTSWGRLGISVPETSKVAPGFKGCLTIELKNLGEAPVPLFPGVRIAQLRVHTLSREARYQGRYEIPTSTEFSRISEDVEMEFLGERRPPLIIGLTGLSKSGRSRVVNQLRTQGFYGESLTAIRRHEMRRAGRSETEDSEREFALELRARRGNGVFAQLLLDKLERMNLDKVVVEGVEHLDEVELLAGCSRFFLIGIEAPFEFRLKWARDYAEVPMTAEELQRSDRWELDGLVAEDGEPIQGAPNIRACLKAVHYTIDNSRDKAALHERIEDILWHIVQSQNLYQFDIG